LASCYSTSSALLLIWALIVVGGRKGAALLADLTLADSIRSVSSDFIILGISNFLKKNPRSVKVPKPKKETKPKPNIKEYKVGLLTIASLFGEESPGYLGW
jgi:hypothetical protein